jgi:hypothetical protein
LRVEGGERLVEKEDVGFEHKGAGERHPLSLTARDLAGSAIVEAFKMNRGKSFRDTRSNLVVRAIADPQTEGDVLEDRQMREESVVLENGVDRPKRRA